MMGVECVGVQRTSRLAGVALESGGRPSAGVGKGSPSSGLRLLSPVGKPHGVVKGHEPAGKAFQDVVYGVLPFFAIMLLSIVIFTAFPEIVTWLPSTIMDIR